jgi:hypothetical protein
MGKKQKYPELIQKIREHKTSVNYSFQKNISYSQMSTYIQCPKRWSLYYKEGHKINSSSTDTIFGTAMHETLQHYLEVYYNESTVKADEIDLEGYFEDKFRDEYLKQYKANNNVHLNDQEGLTEYFNDGLGIIETFKKEKSKYFSKKGWHLVGCEIPLNISPSENNENIVYIGYMDVLLYNEITETFKIIDLKTSRGAWNDSKKKDELKQFQLILYKNFLSEIFQIPIDKIEIEFFILKRKLWDKSDYPQSRIQLFSPPSGKIKQKKANDLLHKFINECFDKNTFKNVEHEYNINPNCKYCPYYKSTLCPGTYKEKKSK